MLRKKPGLVPQQGQIYHKEKKQALFFPLPFLHLYWPQIGWCWQCLSDLLEDQSGEEKCLGVKKRSTAPLEHLIPVGATLWSQQAPKAQPKAPPHLAPERLLRPGVLLDWLYRLAHCNRSRPRHLWICRPRLQTRPLLRLLRPPRQLFTSHSELDQVTAGQTSCECAERGPGGGNGPEQARRGVMETFVHTSLRSTLQPTTITAITVAMLQLYCRPQMWLWGDI